MFILLDGEAFEAALPDMAAGSVDVMVAAHMAGEEPLHETAQSGMG